METLKINESMVYKKFKKLNIFKSQGPDGLHPRVLHELSEVISTQMAELMNRSLEDGQIPWE